MAPRADAVAVMSPVTAICADTAPSPTVTPPAAISRNSPPSTASKADSWRSGMLAMQPLSLGIVEDGRHVLRLHPPAHGVDGDRFADRLASAAALDQAEGDGAAEGRAHIARRDITETAWPRAGTRFLDRVGAGGNNLAGIGR